MSGHSASKMLRETLERVESVEDSGQLLGCLGTVELDGGSDLLYAEAQLEEEGGNAENAGYSTEVSHGLDELDSTGRDGVLLLWAGGVVLIFGGHGP